MLLHYNFSQFLFLFLTSSNSLFIFLCVCSQVRLFRSMLSRGPEQPLQELHDVQVLSIEPVTLADETAFDDDY